VSTVLVRIWDVIPSRKKLAVEFCHCEERERRSNLCPQQRLLRCARHEVALTFPLFSSSMVRYRCMNILAKAGIHHLALSLDALRQTVPC
jgi:hypothetical protein